MASFAPGRLAFAHLVRLASSRPLLMSLLGVALAIGAVLFTATHFSLTTSENDLISPTLPYRQAEDALARKFPHLNAQIVVVIDGQTPELTEEAAEKLEAKLSSDPAMFPSVQRPDGGEFWTREGMLFEPTAQVKADMNRLIAAEPFLGPMAADPSLRGLMNSLSTALQGVGSGQAQLSSLQAPLTSLADTLGKLEQGRPAAFSWQALIGGVNSAQLRKILLVDPRLDYTQLEPGAKASAAIRAAAASLGLTEARGVRVRLTGDVPLEDQEFGSLADHAGVIAIVAGAAIILMLWLAVRSARVIGAIIFTTLAGLAAAAAMGLVIFGTFNVISIAFIPLFVGLGIDFGIQFSVRYRAEHRPEVDLRRALVAAGDGMGRPLALAAFAIAAGFLAFAPTAYIGVSQLGVIAGVGMLIALVLNLTLLPALLMLLRPAPSVRMAPSEEVSRLDRVILGSRRKVLGAALLAAVASAASLPLLRFDFNPIHMRDPHTESVSTLFDLMHDPNYDPDTMEAVRPSLAAAEGLAARAERLPQVDSARTLADFVPSDQGPKLAAIGDASTLLGLELSPLVVSPPPTDVEVVQSLAATAGTLRQVAGSASGPAADAARRLAGELARLSQASPALRAQAAEVLIAPFNTTLTQIQSMLTAEPVSLATLPPTLARDWITPSGEARVSISPKGDPNNDRVLNRFIDAVLTVAPDATGAPMGIREGGRTVVSAFLEAGALSFVAITVLLFGVLRRARDVVITMTPIVLTGLLTLSSCVAIGQPLNFANIIALPLLFGIGVAFHIYFVMSWRSGGSHLLTSSLARAVFFSALTTATGFGSLWLSSHPGTASMGKLLMISLVWTLVSALIFQPALMGPPPADAAPAGRKQN